MDEANNPSPELALEAEEVAPDVQETEENSLSTEASQQSQDQDNEEINPEDTKTEETETEETSTDFVSVEYDGTEYDVPPVLKDAFMRQSDYTQKTQSLAEKRKEVEFKAVELQQQQELQQQEIEKIVTVRAIDQQLEQYNALNWDQLYQEDTASAAILDRKKRDLETQRSQTINQLNLDRQNAFENQREKHAKMLEKGQKVLEKEIENWSPEVAKQISEYGISQGLSPEAVQRIADPVHVKLLDKARKYDAIVAKQKAKTQSPPPQLAVKVKGKRAAVTKDPDKMSTEEWLKMRNKQVEKRIRA